MTAQRFRDSIRRAPRPTDVLRLASIDLHGIDDADFAGDILGRALIEPRAHGDAFERVKDACKWEPRVR